MVFEWGVDQDWLVKNPMKNIPIGSTVNRDNNRTISMDEYAKLLAACRHQEWRTIIALARIGGLRCPSEIQRLRWSDIHWADNRFLVRSPKTEHHEGHRERLVPLFPELQAELERQFSLDETKGNEFVIERYQKTSWNLHAAFEGISKRAGLGTIIRPFDNMRMSRSNEVWERFGSGKENLWIGHSEMIRRKHYQGELSDEAFAEAAGATGATKADAESQVPHAPDHAEPTEKDGKLE